MIDAKTFFEGLDFSFEHDLVQKEIVISGNEDLTRKIKNRIYFYNSPKNINTSFYYLDIINLDKDELFEIKRYIWNEDKSDLYFYPENNESISLYYSKSNPIKNQIKSKINSFNGLNDSEVESIKKWNFESGSFWFTYEGFAKRIKENDKIDKLLIDRLKDLKNELLSCLGINKSKHVQALIDRTLFTKFLEDNHIINSYFYNYYFPEIANASYKTLLENRDANSINILFTKINEIFDNILFETPHLEEQQIIDASEYIYNAISGEQKGQLSLFDFRFDLIPIEFISHIYEVFLEEERLNDGIFYTPPKLAQLIVDDTITKKGKVLDPACGSGMFLILSFRKMLNNAEVFDLKGISNQIEFRLDLLKNNIFGIEKQYIAWRLCIFSLYLEIFNGLEPSEIKDYIAFRIKSGDIKIFKDFSTNIINGNSLEIDDNKLHFKGKKFDYIIGNPPFLKIDRNSEEIRFIRDHKFHVKEYTYFTSQIIGSNQISQAFMVKIKDWANEGTNFGFVLNSSNFYNESKSINFQEFFFQNYQIINFYELSKVNRILFKNTREPVVVVVFNNKSVNENKLNYYPVDMELLSETFKILVIKEDKKIEIKQKQLLTRERTLREILISNDFDLTLTKKIMKCKLLKDHFSDDENFSSFKGLQRASNLSVREYYKNDSSILSLSNKDIQDKFANDRYLSPVRTEYHITPYIYSPECLSKYALSKVSGYMNEKDINVSNFQRPRNKSIYSGKKILFSKFGNSINAVFIDHDLVFSDLIYVIKIQNENYYLLYTAILNSDLISYFLTQKYRKRIDSNFPNITTEAIKNIPIPNNFNNSLFIKISKLSKDLTEGKQAYEGDIKAWMNEMIFDLYDLSFLERQRVKDYYAPTRKVEESDLEEYKKTLLYTIEMYFDKHPRIEYSIDLKFGFDLLVVGLYFNGNDEMPKSEKVLKYKVDQIMKEAKSNLFLMQEILIGKDCIYIIKDRQLKNWTVTKAYEDGKSILNNIS